MKPLDEARKAYRDGDLDLAVAMLIECVGLLNERTAAAEAKAERAIARARRGPTVYR